MKKFKVYVPCEYIVGHLRYGHGEAIIEAENEEEAKKKAQMYEDFDIEIDDFEIDDCGNFEFEDMKIEEITEEI